MRRGKQSISIFGTVAGTSCSSGPAEPRAQRVDIYQRIPRGGKERQEAGTNSKVLGKKFFERFLAL